MVRMTEPDGSLVMESVTMASEALDYRRSQASVTVFRFFYYTSYIIYIILAAKKNYDDFMTDMTVLFVLFPSPKEDLLVVPLDS